MTASASSGRRAIAARLSRHRSSVGVVLLAASTLTVIGGAPAGAAAAEVTPSFATGTPLVQRHIDTVPNTSGITGVVAYDTKGYPAPGTAGPGSIEHNHVHTPVTYSVTPPVGGPHNAKWLNAGTYTKPVPSSRAVHDLEHGAIWITYEPGISSADLTTLYSFVHKQSVITEGRLTPGGPVQGNRFIVVSPWPTASLGAPVVISSWGYQLKVDSVSDSRLQPFINKFRRNKTYSPEISAPVDGVSVSIGGRAFRDGGVYPNPDSVTMAAAYRGGCCGGCCCCQGCGETGTASQRSRHSAARIA